MVAGAEGEPREPPHELEPLAAYQLWADTYVEASPNPVVQASRAALAALLPDLVNRVCLDVGCGPGYWTRRLSAAGARAVVGVDLSPAMLRRTSGAATFAAADMAALPFPGATFDLVISSLALGHAISPGAAIAEAGRVLRPGGRLVVADLHSEVAARGWRRTFRDGAGRLWAVRWRPLDRPTLVLAARAAGLSPAAWTEYNLAPDQLAPGSPPAMAGPAIYGFAAVK